MPDRRQDLVHLATTHSDFETLHNIMSQTVLIGASRSWFASCHSLREWSLLRLHRVLHCTCVGNLALHLHLPVNDNVLHLWNFNSFLRLLAVCSTGPWMISTMTSTCST